MIEIEEVKKVELSGSEEMFALVFNMGNSYGLISIHVNIAEAERSMEWRKENYGTFHGNYSIIKTTVSINQGEEA